MKREYKINDNDYDLLFWAPLTTDTVDVVNNYTGIIDSRFIPVYDVNKGVYLNNYNKRYHTAALRWVIPSEFDTILNGYTDFLSQITLIQIQGGRTQYGYYVQPNGRRVMYFRRDGGYTAVPNNVQGTLYDLCSTNPSTKVSTHTWYSTFNDTVVTTNESAWVNNDGMRTFFDWGGSNKGFNGWIKDIKIYGKKQ